MAVEDWCFLNWRLQIFSKLTKEIYLCSRQDYWPGDSGMWAQEAQATYRSASTSYTLVYQEMIGMEAST